MSQLVTLYVKGITLSNLMHTSMSTLHNKCIIMYSHNNSVCILKLVMDCIMCKYHCK